MNAHIATDERIILIQQLRGVAVLLVVLVHAINVADYRAIDLVEPNSGFLASFLAINEFGACGVDLFFVISGFVMASMIERRADLRVAQFARDRIIRIVPLYWLVSLPFYFLLQALGQPVSGRSVLLSVTIIPLDDFVYAVLLVGWSLAFEMAFYALVAVCIVLPRDVRLAALVVLLCGSAGLSTVFVVPVGPAAPLLNAINLEFLAGVLVYLVWNALGKSRRVVAGAVLGFCGGIMLLSTAFYGFGFSAEFFQVLRGETGLARAWFWGWPWMLIMLGLLFLRRPNIHPHATERSTMLGTVGDASYSIYLIHLAPCLLATKLFPGGWIAPDFLVTIVYMFGLGLGFPLHYWVEKPLLRGLRRMWVGNNTPTIPMSVRPSAS